MSNFPIIQHIDDVLPHIEGRDEFVVAERDWGTVIDYRVVTSNTFDDDPTNPLSAKIRRECRGLKFSKTGDLLARPYHKFFNLGEREETTNSVLSAQGRFLEDFCILPKLDGSMVHPIVWNDEVHFCTRMGTTDVAAQALEFAQQSVRLHEPMYLDFCYDLAKVGITPIFEWCTRQQRIVLDYPDDQLVLTAIRTNESGAYCTRPEMNLYADKYNIPVVDLFEGDWDGINAFAKMVHDIEEAEGFVLRWEDGSMIKMKGEWYTLIHRTKDSISYEKRIIGLILNGKLDDIKPHLLANDFDRMARYEMDFWQTINETVSALDTCVIDCSEYCTEQGMDERAAKGYFAQSVVSQYKNDLVPWKGLLFSAWDRKNPTLDIVVGYLRKRFSLDVQDSLTNGTQAIVDELRAANLLPTSSWLDY
jgi:RNA ligase